MHIELVRCFSAGKLQHGGPEQRVKIDDVFTDEVHLLSRIAGGQQRIEIDAELGAVSLERGEITDWCIQPHVKILARGIGDFDPEVGRVTRNIPVAQVDLVVAFAMPEPFAGFSKHFGLETFVTLGVGPCGPVL